MRNLRQFFRRSGLLSSEKRRRRSNQKRRSELSQRRLTSEVLEKRQLLAGDILTSDIGPLQNQWNQYDVDDNGHITANDALRIINRLNGSFEGEQVADDAPQMYYDVNGDAIVSAGDALGVINAMSRGEEVGEQIELILTARDLNDDPIEVVNGAINVDVNQPFDLEVSYDDLRLFNDRLGAFQLFTDISVSQGGVLAPILNETQRIIIDGSVTSTPFPSSVTFSIPETPPSTTGGSLSYESQFADFGNDTQSEVINALLEFGYARSQFEISALDFGNNDIGFEIHWVGDEFGNVDLPNISVEVNENGGAEVPTQTVEFAPFLGDGTPNGDAVRFNINSFSRTFNTNEEFYSSQNRGSFDANNGFVGVGGLGQVPLEGGGIPQLTDDGSFPEPFDAFSIRVMVTQPVTGLVVGVNPGEDAEATLLYGEDNALTQDLVLIETDSASDAAGNGIANVTINAGVTSIVAGNGTLAVTEDTDATLDLATLISGGTADTVVVSLNGTLGTGTISGTTLTYSPNLNAVGTDSIEYTVTAGTDTATGTIAVTITGVNDDPVANDDPGLTTQVDTALTIQAATLLGNDTDVDGDTLVITAVGAPADTNATAVLSGTTITYTPSSGNTGTDTFTYTISDNNGGTDTATVTVTINAGQVNAPVAGNSSLSLAEDSNAVTLNLATLITGDAADSFAIVGNGSLGTATISGSTLSYTPNLNANGNDTVTYNATNGGGTSNTGTISLTITPVNDDPVAVDDSASTQAGVAVVIPGATLVSNDTDVDNDTLTVTAVGTPMVANATAVLNGGNVTYTPAAGFTGSDSFQYTVSDGNGGTDTGTVNVTVTSDPVVAATAADGSLTVNQGGTATLDLSTLIAGTAPITLTVTTNGNIGNATINGTTLSYVSNAAAGSDTIVYTASNAGGSDTGTISVTVNAVNTITAGDGTLNTNEDTTATLDLATLVSGATNPTITIVTNGSLGNASVSGTTLTYTPNANVNGNDTIVYQAASGGDSDTGTINVAIAAVNDPPVAVNDTATAFTGATVQIQVLNNDNAGPNENETLTVIAASSNNGTATPNSDGTISFTPTAGFTGNATINYTIQDSGGLQDSAIVSVTVQNFNPSSISGSLFIDHSEGRDSSGAVVRNGVKDADEKGLAGVAIRLSSAATANSTGQAVGVTALTDLNGSYSFENVAPGTYQVTYDVPDSVIFVNEAGQQITGTVTETVVVGSQGGVVSTGNNFAAIGTNGSLNTVDILASSYLRTNASIAQITEDGREGGIVSLDANGNQEFFAAGSGFEGIVFGELVLNSERDAALLTVIEEDGDVMTARLNSEHFIVSNDGTGVQFFGGLNDFDFVNADTDLVQQEFANFRNAIDQVLGGLGN